jgi:hypothetical protein
MPQAVHIQASSRAFRIAFVSLPQIKAGVGNKCSQSAAAEDLPGQMDASDRLNIYEELREEAAVELMSDKFGYLPNI